MSFPFLRKPVYYSEHEKDLLSQKSFEKGFLYGAFVEFLQYRFVMQPLQNPLFHTRNNFNSNFSKLFLKDEANY